MTVIGRYHPAHAFQMLKQDEKKLQRGHYSTAQNEPLQYQITCSTGTSCIPSHPIPRKCLGAPIKTQAHSLLAAAVLPSRAAAAAAAADLSSRHELAAGVLDTAGLGPDNHRLVVGLRERIDELEFKVPEQH